MRMMVKFSVPVEAGNKASEEQKWGEIIGKAHEQLNPEAAYFFAENGRRTSLFVFDMKDASDIPGIAEPWCQGLNAEVEFTPVMNADDLKAGVEKVG